MDAGQVVAYYGLCDSTSTSAARAPAPHSTRSTKAAAFLGAGLLSFISGLALGNYYYEGGFYVRPQSASLPGWLTTGRPLTMWAKVKDTTPMMASRNKDPNAPKRGLTAYIQFVKDQRPAVVKKHPEKSVTEIMALMGGLWKTLSEKEKAPYIKQAELDKKRYEEEMLSYVPPPPEPSKGTKKGSRGKAANYDADNYDSEGEEAAPKKKAAKVKDPNAPKRPKTGYFLFLDDARAVNPKAKSTDLGLQWQGLPEKQKEKYNKKAAELRKEYNKQLGKE